MRWDGLFADLEAQSAALEMLERAGEVDERTRGEVGALRLRDRAGAAVGLPVHVRSAGGLTLSGRLVRAAGEWWLLDEGSGREVIVTTAAIVSVRGLARYSAVPASEGAVESRLGLRQVLRGVARDRSAGRIHLADGSTIDATLDRVGADFVEVATHPAGEARRRRDVRDVELLPLRAVVALRRAAE